MSPDTDAEPPTTTDPAQRRARRVEWRVASADDEYPTLFLVREHEVERQPLEADVAS